MKDAVIMKLVSTAERRKDFEQCTEKEVKANETQGL